MTLASHMVKRLQILFDLLRSYLSSVFRGSRATEEFLNGFSSDASFSRQETVVRFKVALEPALLRLATERHQCESSRSTNPTPLTVCNSLCPNGSSTFRLSLAM